GVTINLYRGASAAGSPYQTAVTAADGSYSFTDLAPGSYFVQEVVPDGYAQTAGAAGYAVTVGGDGMQSGAAPVADLDFGNFQPGSISGIKFNDVNGDGVRQSGEAGLAGWTVQLLDAGGNVLKSTTTGPGGSYSFTGLAAGTHRVREVGQSGWAQMTA